MKDLIRDSAIGQLIRFITIDRMLRHPENEPGFTLPESFNVETKVATQDEAVTPTSVRENNQDDSQTVDIEALENLHRQASISTWQAGLNRAISRATLGLEEDTTSREIKPTITQEGKLLVTWYSTDDPENPQNWSSLKKFWVSFLIWYVV